MFIKEFSYIVEHEIFEVGDKVSPLNKNCPLDDGVYIVTECTEPKYEGDIVCVFVDGRKTGIDGRNLLLANKL